MQRVGDVVRTAQNLAVARVPEESDAPDIGRRVIDESLEEIGDIVDVFGPVERPYVAVAVEDGVALPGLVGEPLYAR
jgi:RNA-binding protein